MNSTSSYNWDPNEYHVSSEAQKKLAEELLSKAGLRGNERVLDLGCGDGKITAKIANLVQDGFVIGIDSSPEMIKFAQDHYPVKEYPNLTFQQMDIRDFSFEGHFDLIFSNAALHWVEDQPSVLRCVRNNLCPGGRFLIQCGGKGNVAEFYEIVKKLIRKEPWNKYFKGFSMPYYFFSDIEYSQWVIDAGLKPVRVELIPKDMVQKGREGLASWVRTTWLPFTGRLPEEIRENFIYNIVDSYIREYPVDNDGKVHAKLVRLEVEAINE